MSTGLSPVNNVVPWSDLRLFASRYSDIFLPNSRIMCFMDVTSRHEPDAEVQKVRVKFAYPTVPRDSAGLKIYGLTKSALGIVSEFKLDLEKGHCRITLPQFGCKVELDEDKFSLSLPENYHPDVYTFTEEAVDFFSIVLHSIVSPNEDVVQQELDNLLFAKYPHRYN